MKKIVSIIGMGILLLLGVIIYSLTTRTVSGFQDQTSFALPKPTFNNSTPTLQEPSQPLPPAMPPPAMPSPAMPPPAMPPTMPPPPPAMPSMPATPPPAPPAMPPAPPAMPPTPSTPSIPKIIPPPSVSSSVPDQTMQGMTPPKISGFSNYNGSSDSDLGGYSSYPF